MKLKKLVTGLALSMILLVVTVSGVSAQSLVQTIVTGVVYGTNNLPVNGGTVSVTCGTGTQLAGIQPDGTYQAIFAQTACKAGDTASAVASTSQGNGSNSASVQNTAINGPVVDLDIAVVNVNISVPEFGEVTGLVSLLGAAGSFFYIKYKSVIA